MERKVCCRVDVFVERLCHSLKYEAGCFHGCDTVTASAIGIGRDLTLGSNRQPHPQQPHPQQPHPRLAVRTPDGAYFFPLPLAAAG